MQPNIDNEEEFAARKYIRHPLDVTIRYMLDEVVPDAPRSLKDISEGGLCFVSAEPVVAGSKIHIEIPIRDPAYQIDGVVMWCQERNGYEIGVRFDDEAQKFSLRMVEQACHIKHYMNTVLEKEGRELTVDEAAMEWIAKFAGIFPR